MYSIMDTLHLNDFLAESILTRRFSCIPRIILLFTYTTFNVHHAKRNLIDDDIEILKYHVCAT